MHLKNMLGCFGVEFSKHLYIYPVYGCIYTCVSRSVTLDLSVVNFSPFILSSF